MNKQALIIIDMENGFINPESAQCIKMAAQTVDRCAAAASEARKRGIPVIFVNRIYRKSGVDVEHTRYRAWYDGGRAMSEDCEKVIDSNNPIGLSPEEKDIVIIKPRFSAFFMTELDLILRRLGIDTVILTGTTTPNCIRTTCYDAISLDYNVIVIDDCCSSQTEEIQRANIFDMKNIGAHIITADDFIANKYELEYDSLAVCQEEVRNGI